MFNYIQNYLFNLFFISLIDKIKANDNYNSNKKFYHQKYIYTSTKEHNVKKEN